MASGYSDLSEIRRDGRGYGLNQKPPKINLLNERPRRESLIEQQLTGNIVRPTVFGSGQQQVMGHSQQQQQQQHTSTRSQQAAVSGGGGAGQHQGCSAYQEQHPNNFAYYNNPQSHSVTTKTVEMTQVVNTAAATSPVKRSPATDRQLTNNQAYANYAEITRDLAEKEAKLKREMAYLNQQLSPWARPRVIREPRKEPPPRAQRDQHKWTKECPSVGLSGSRPASRASSTTEADLMEKTAKLLQDVEEIERKPIKTQQILIESGVGTASSKSRSATPGSQDTPGNSGSIHTAIIRVPNVDIDNKSPLPFAYDNFSTLGVRGNIASVGAAPPESPYPPIFPQIKRTPSPTVDRRRR